MRLRARLIYNFFLCGFVDLLLLFWFYTRFFFVLFLNIYVLLCATTSQELFAVIIFFGFTFSK